MHCLLLHNNFDSSAKLFLNPFMDLYLAKFLDISVQSLFSCI